MSSTWRFLAKSLSWGSSFGIWFLILRFSYWPSLLCRVRKYRLFLGSRGQWVPPLASFSSAHTTVTNTLSANFKWAASQGVTLTNYLAIRHPSQPNYVAAVGGSTHGFTDDTFQRIDSSAKTIVDLLETKGVSWSEYQQDSPYSGFEGNYVNQETGANDFVRKHKWVIIVGISASPFQKLTKSCMADEINTKPTHKLRFRIERHIPSSQDKKLHHVRKRPLRQ